MIKVTVVVHEVSPAAGREAALRNANAEQRAKRNKYRKLTFVRYADETRMYFQLMDNRARSQRGLISLRIAAAYY